MTNISTLNNIINNKPNFNKYKHNKIKNKLYSNNLDSEDGGIRKEYKFKESKDKLKLISIITISFNAEDYIEDTILSILNQTYTNIEYIIIDGKSTDNTKMIINKYNDNIDYWVSEKDTGIYNAMNKGLFYASGDYIIYVNAGDYLHKDAILNSINKTIDISYGKTFFVDEGKIVKKNYNIFNDNMIEGLGFMFPSTIINIEVFNKIGIFNENYKIAGDADFLVRAYLNDLKFIQRTEESFSYMSIGGISDTQSENGYKEYLDSLLENNIIKKSTINELLNRYHKKSYLKNIIKKFISLNDLKQYIYHIGIYFINLLYNNIPTFKVKKYLLSILKITVGKKSYIHTPLTLFGIKNLIIGNNTTINSGVYLDNRKKITIGSNVNISHDVKIYTLGHDVNSIFFEAVGKEVIIKDYVVIFPNVLIMPGVTINKGAVIYPGSVIIKDVKEYSIVGGNPAKHIVYRNKHMKYKLDYKYWLVK